MDTTTEQALRDALLQAAQDFDAIARGGVGKIGETNVPEAAERCRRAALSSGSSEPVTLTYTNWRGETAARTLIPQYVWHGSTEWHPSPQWLLHAIDVEKGAPRDFALKDFGAPTAEVEKRGVGIGMAIAAGIVMYGWGDTVHAGEILSAAGFHSVDGLRDAGVDDYDINLVTPALRDAPETDEA